MSATVVAFDLYGTLLATDSVADQLASLFGQTNSDKIATRARALQLEYTWRINNMGLYRSFSDLTRASFRQAASEFGIILELDQEQRIMRAYDGLNGYDDGIKAMALLAKDTHLDPWIFSNGTTSMIMSSLQSSPALSASRSLFPEAKVVSVDAIQAFKPDPRTYAHLARTCGFESRLGDIWLVSSNPFDAVGAVSAGLNSAWVDRTGSGWRDGLGNVLGIRPTLIVKGVDEAVEKIRERTSMPRT